jgi:hypothetical protein
MDLPFHPAFLCHNRLYLLIEQPPSGSTLMRNFSPDYTRLGSRPKVVWQEETSYHWERGRLRPHSTLNLKLLDAVTVSHFALIAGEDARVPITHRRIPDRIQD